MAVMDGCAFVEAYRQDTRCDNTPIVVVSAAHGLSRELDRLAAKGVRAVLTKPFDLGELVTTVDRLMPAA
jgi:CheY-like chemotaxis protein